MSRLTRALALLGAIALAGVACGGPGTKASAPTATARSSSGTAAPCPPSAALPTPVNDHGAAPATAAAVSIEANDFFFAPTCVTSVPAGTITLIVHNVSQTLHNVTVPSLGIDRDIPPGQTVTAAVVVGAAPLPFFCKYHRTSGMVGALVPAGASATTTAGFSGRPLQPLLQPRHHGPPAASQGGPDPVRGG